MTALFVEQLTTIDFSYLCPARGVVGETWLVDVILTGELNEEGMVFDFGHVKKEIKAMIDAHADHALLVPVKNPNITLLELGGSRDVTLTLDQGGIIGCRAPDQAILPLQLEEITPAGVRPIIEAHVLKGLPENVTGIELHLYPQKLTGAYYHYSHGLKKHKGDCQRIAHGHRSPLSIYIDNTRREDIEHDCAEQWRDIYIASQEDLQGTTLIDECEHNVFSYQAIQGYFELTIPASHCYVMDTDTTVELLATHLAQKLGQQFPCSNIKVIANEGFRKGAIAHYFCQG
ncbi:6-carboxytetrahydropterin synthase [Sansalvadorimonas sp. 2012CJ34-2]|uniref:6-carboxy-5,6,7,8-tetrahydropterin synthase n=1 Tax=Parendozoicomonas callyspongiae TaxID=2942213 RepID=A0ABT0PL75_9GAMM|nr:6-carboxytetrahydropterin synthase [Sansalvadorimonas sp. 2012CJ34-2]MCL6272134.1 6-carboxytetrahydropterin synthase [Sansalvadorimonas sp. 2012CJ34-2]